MYLLEEYFVEWDAERWSFYVIKDRKDPLLYCGPMWDFDHSAGTMLYGTYPETTVSTLMLRDNRHGWQDEDGNTVSADTVIDRDRTFTPVYR